MTQIDTQSDINRQNIIIKQLTQISSTHKAALAIHP